MRRKFLSLLLALALCLGTLPITALAADTLNYLALGDSITSGYGLSSSSDGFVEKLADEIDATSTTNKGVPGWTTADLLSALTDSGNQNYASYTAAVESADVITITIGGNDLMAVLYQCIATLYNSTYGTSLTAANIQAVLASPSTNAEVYSNILTLVTGLTSAQAMSYVSSFSTAITATVENINSIAKAIRALNSNAVILVANQYNPYQWFSSTGDYAMLNTLFSLVVSNYNKALNSGATSDYVVVDVASVINTTASTTALTNADDTGTVPNLDFHPNAAGHTKIAEAMAAAYKDAADSGSSGGGSTTETVSVSYSLTNLTSSNEAKTQTKSEAYTTTLTAEDGYTLPDSITVTVGGIPLTAGTYYTYDSATGAVALPAAVVLGDIVITAAGAEIVTVPTVTAIARSDDSESEYISGTWTAAKTVVITASGSEAVSGIEGYQYYNDASDEWIDMAGDKLTVAGMSEDSFIFRAVSKDGNYSAASEPFVVKNDTSDPTIFVSGDTTTILQSGTVTIAAATSLSGVAKVEVSTDGGATYTDITDSCANGYTVTANGTYTFRVTNGAGTTATASITYANIDTEAPTISGIVDGETYCGDVTFSVTADDLASVTVDGEAVTEYTLTADGKSHTVVATDQVGNSTTVTVTVNDVHTWDEGVVTTAPTCTKKGEILYTCTVCGATKTEAVEATGHSYGEPVFTWSESGKRCKVSFTCVDCGKVKTLTATVTSAVKTAATSTKEGVTTYTATVTFEGVEYTATKDVADIPATGSSSSSSSSSSSKSSSSTATTSPKTGDEFHVLLWLVLTILAAFGLIATAIYSRKKTNEP